LVEWAGIDPHDLVVVTGKTATFVNPLYHYSFRDLADHWRSNNRLSSVAASELSKQNAKSGLFTIISHSLFAFIKSYLIKRGFLEGRRGFIQAIMIATGVALKYAKLWELQNVRNSQSVNRS